MILFGFGEVATLKQSLKAVCAERDRLRNRVLELEAALRAFEKRQPAPFISVGDTSADVMYELSNPTFLGQPID